MGLKALILAGGRGKRLNNHIKEENKCMLKFDEKPLIKYSLENAAKLDVEEIIIVVGYLAEKIINAFGNSFKGIPIKYVIQLEQKGLVHAIECSKNAIGNSDFFLFLGDEFLINANHISMVKKFSKECVFTVCGVVKVNDMTQISKTYAILFNNKSHQIVRLIEKPKHPPNNLMGTGNCIFKNKIFDYIHAGVPVLASNLPEIAQIINKYNIGIIIDEVSPEIIAEKITEMINDTIKYNKWKENLKTAANELCWENEEQKLIKVYKSLV